MHLINICQYNRKGRISSIHSTIFFSRVVCQALCQALELGEGLSRKTEMRSEEQKGTDFSIGCLVDLGKIMKTLGNLLWDTLWFGDCGVKTVDFRAFILMDCL